MKATIWPEGVKPTTCSRCGSPMLTLAKLIEVKLGVQVDEPEEPLCERCDTTTPEGRGE